MEDGRIVKLYFARDEAAITETETKYGRLVRSVVKNILRIPEDREETVNDTYLGLWNAIPPERPRALPAFIRRIARNLALKKYDYITAERRSPDCVASMEELEECVSGGADPVTELEKRRLEEAISAFLRGQKPERRRVFVLRYWYFDSMQDIRRATGFSEGKITSMLHQMRVKLREYLKSEGFEL